MNRHKHHRVTAALAATLLAGSVLTTSATANAALVGGLWNQTEDGFTVTVNGHDYFFGAWAQGEGYRNNLDDPALAWPVKFGEKTTTYGNDKVDIRVPQSWHNNFKGMEWANLTEAQTAWVTSVPGNINTADSRAAVAAIVAINWGEGPDTMAAVNELFKQHPKVRDLASRYVYVAKQWDENNLRYAIWKSNPYNGLHVGGQLQNDAASIDNPWVPGLRFKVDLKGDSFKVGAGDPPQAIWSGTTGTFSTSNSKELSDKAATRAKGTDVPREWVAVFDADVSDCLKTDAPIRVTPPSRPSTVGDKEWEAVVARSETNVMLLSNQCGTPHHIHGEVHGSEPWTSFLVIEIDIPDVDIAPTPSRDTASTTPVPEETKPSVPEETAAPTSDNKETSEPATSPSEAPSPSTGSPATTTTQTEGKLAATGASIVSGVGAVLAMILLGAGGVLLRIRSRTSE